MRHGANAAHFASAGAGAADDEGGAVGDRHEVGARRQQPVEGAPGLGDVAPGPRRKQLKG